MIFIFLFFASFPVIVKAQDVSKDIIISPSIIDEECEKRDILKYDIKVKNISGGKITLYAIVNDISEKDGIIKYKDPSDLDLSTSLTRWLEFRRAVVELDIDEEKIIPLKINVHEDAPPGVYHARIAISKGSNRPQATENAYKVNTEELLINLEVSEHIIEKIEIAEFKPAKAVFTNKTVSFVLKLKNIGNKNETPRGEIVFYNSRGKEISSVLVNPSKKIVSSGVTEDFLITTNMPVGFGKFKAKLRLEYGNDNKDLQDVVYFLLMPKFILFFIIIVVLFLTTFLSLNLSRKKKKEIMRREEMGNFVREKIINDEEVSLEKEEEVILNNENRKDINEVVIENSEHIVNNRTLNLRDGKKERKDDGHKYVINLRSK